MSREQNIAWIKRVLAPEEITGKWVIDVGSRRWNEEPTIHDHIASNAPGFFLGVDHEPGDEVDVVYRAEHLSELFQPEMFDVVLNVEVMEHVEDWRALVRTLKHLVSPGGVLIVTTRMPGYPMHGYPSDFWRFEEADMRKIFSDMSIEQLHCDVEDSGIYLKVRKPFQETNLNMISIPSMNHDLRRIG